MASLSCGSVFARQLRKAAPNLSRRFFACHQSLGHRLQAAQNTPQLRPAYQTYCQPFKTQQRSLSASARRFTTATLDHERIDLAQHAVKQATKAAKSSRFPDTSTNAVAYWLLASAASVFGIVVFGGWTRLTESGLSITEWKPVTGSLPPMSEAEWASEFLKYQSSPEFRLLNSRMTLEEFKSIYWMEWIHRIWGRAVGLTFVLPAAYFILRGRVSKPMALRLGGIAGLIGFQGFIGWWMVKSGLKDDLFAPGSHPRVSQYRLTSHLGTAFLCYLAMLWNGLTILHTNRFLALPASTAASHLQSLSRPHLRTLKTTSLALTALLFTTALSGALVAGLDAGLIYNEFPYMGVGLTPPTRELLDPFYSHTPPPHPDLLWRNMLENPSTVQLDHRILATSSFTSVMALWAYTRYSPAVRKAMTPPMKRGVHGLVGFVWLQVILGISTLIYLVPLPLASAHQAGALALLSMAVVFDRRLYVPRAAVRAWERRGRTAAGLERGTRGMAGLGGGGGGQIGGAGVVQNRGFASGSMRLARSADVRVV